MKVFIFSDIEKTNCEKGFLLKQKKPMKAEFYENQDVALLTDDHECLTFKRKTFGCPYVMKTWTFYIQDKQAEGFEKVFDYLTKPYKKQLDKERGEKARLKKEVRYLENHIHRYLPEHELMLDIGGGLHLKPKGRKLVK
jgi:hypothetical protein